MEIRWSLPAAEDLEHICEWIERDNPEAARRVAQTIYEECGRLKNFPNLGRASRRMAGRRELIFSPLPYIVVYQVTQDAIEISHLPRCTGLAVKRRF
jgi:plasmid stabilization system protein ParE